MNRSHARSLPSLAVAGLLFACAPAPDGQVAEDAGSLEASAPAEDAAELRALVGDFLANAGAAAAHERFWADDLVYTSSDGTRTTKADILGGFGSEEADERAGPVYSGEDVDVRLYGSTAVVAFRLVATPAEGADGDVQQYFNTGTFLKRDGIWKAVAWQATRIP